MNRSGTVYGTKYGNEKATDIMIKVNLDIRGVLECIAIHTVCKIFWVRNFQAEVTAQTGFPLYDPSNSVP